METVNIGEKLLKIGFATREDIPKPLSDNSKYLKYYKILQNAENYALRKQLGLKYYIKPTKEVIMFLLGNLAAFSVSSTKTLVRAPSRLHKLYIS